MNSDQAGRPSGGRRFQELRRLVPYSVGGFSMRYARQQIVSIRWVPAMLPLLAALVTGCRGQVEGVGPGAGANTGTAGNGAAGSIGNDTPCTGASDPRTVVAQQRIMLLTSWERVNTISYLIDPTFAS